MKFLPKIFNRIRVKLFGLTANEHAQLVAKLSMKPCIWNGGWSEISTVEERKIFRSTGKFPDSFYEREKLLELQYEKDRSWYRRTFPDD